MPAELTSRQRLLAALKRQPIDRVPFLETVIDETVALRILGHPVPADLVSSELGSEGGAVLSGTLLGSQRYALSEIVDALDLDGFGMYLFAPSQRIDVNINGHSMASGGRIKTRADLNLLSLPDPDDPGLYEPYRSFIHQYRAASSRALFCFLNLCSDPVILGMGFEHFALCLYEDRGLVEDLFEFYSSWHARVVANLSGLDFDFLWFGDDIAFKTQPFVSPRIFRQLFLPHYRRVVEHIHKPWIFHSDGNLLPILDDLLSLGMQGLHPIEPGAMDIAYLKRRYGGSLCLVGGIDVDLLSRGEPGEVAQRTREIIAIAAPGGGYIAGSSNSLPYYCKPENVVAMRKAIAQYGHYPIIPNQD